MFLRAVVTVVPALALALASPGVSHAAGCAGAGYPGDDASRESIAGWMAQGAMAVGLPGELPVMGALVESGLRNLSSGDADAVGYFQTRVSIWDRGPYAGFPDDPELQLKWFVDLALDVKARRIAAGEAHFGSDPSRFGEWAADVLRPPEQDRHRYQLRFEEARALVAAGCTPSPVLGGAAEDPGAITAPTVAPDVTPRDPIPAPDVTPPVLRLRVARTQNVLRHRAVRIAVACPAETCTATVRGSIVLLGAARTYPIRARAAIVTAGERAALSLPLKRTLLRRIRRALERGSRPRARLTVSVRDSAGNVASVRRSVRLRAAT